jgi:hypothetical protein
MQALTNATTATTNSTVELILSAAASWARKSAPSTRVSWRRKAQRDADRAEAEAWSIRMEGYRGPAQPSATITQCLNGGLGWLEVECNRCKTRASMPLDAIRRPRSTPI